MAKRATKIERPEDLEIEITPISQFEIVEGLIAEGIKSIKESLDVLFVTPGDMDLGVFGHDIVDFLTAMHKVMSDGTSDKNRRSYQKAFTAHRPLPKI